MSPALREALAPAPARTSAAFDQQGSRVIKAAVRHSLFWLVVANTVGVLLAAMLLLPGINDAFGGWTYGRWMTVHLNLQLYGWCSLPLVAFLFRVYKVDSRPAALWADSALWGWSAALAFGAVSWLQGHGSGKLFLDWSGYSRVLFPLALLFLWALLTYSFVKHWSGPPTASWRNRATRLLGLVLLLAVPPILYLAASPNLYPPINPDSGGPTGASQLESTLVIIAILLLLPLGISRRCRDRLPASRHWRLRLPWIVFAAEVLLCLGLGRADVSHHRPVQWISLGSLLVWIPLTPLTPLTPLYYSVFSWHPNTRRWRIAFLAWWSVLVPTGWMLFLPHVLDHFKFTDGLVGHSLLAMAGFVSSLLLFVMAELLGDDGWIFNMRWSFVTWHVSVALYVALMFYAGWLEGSNPAFSFMPGPLRNGIYLARLLLGLLILIASIDWFYWAFTLPPKPLRETA